MKICVFSLGCKVNQYESEGILHALEERGHEVSEELCYADIYILNTCAVTSLAERKSRQVVARVKKYNPNARIIVCGCAAEKSVKNFEGKGVELVIGNANKNKIPDMLEESGVNVAPLPKEFEDGLTAKSNKTRLHLKVQDGCDNFCSYCIIPYLRGRSRSRSVSSILAELKSPAPETVITGINLSDYGKGINSSLTELIKALKGVETRIRLGSLEARVISEELLVALSGLKDFCPHFHLSLQSGSNAVIKAMNRHYTAEEFAEKIKLIRKHFPMAGITTDIIVGYPAETEEDFLTSQAFASQVAFSDLHVFPYSKREGTVGAKLGVLPPEVVEDRAHRLNETKQKLKSDFIRKNLGTVAEVLVEETVDGYSVGYSKNYLRTYVKGDLGVGKTYRVELKEEYNDGAIGEVVK